MRFQSATPFRDQHDVGNFKRPDRGHDQGLATEGHKKPLGDGTRLIGKTPGQCRRGVDHDYAHYLRPSLIMSRILMVGSGLMVLRSSRKPSTISSCVILRLVSVIGTSIAVGTPCRVIVIFSPCSTRSNSSDKCVLASKAPTEFMLPPIQLV